MPEPATTAPEPEPEPFRVSDDDLDDLASTLAATIAEVRRHGVILDRLNRDIRHLPAPAGPDDIQLLRLGESARGADRTQWSEIYVEHTRPTAPHTSPIET